MSAAKEVRFGELAPKYSFMMNPYPDVRVWRCPCCERKTGQRKVPLLIHVDPTYFIALNYTCKYCPHCDLLVAHKHELEHLLRERFGHFDPQAIGNEYLVLGTVTKEAWLRGMKQSLPVAEMERYVHDFKCYYRELQMTQGGWFREGQEPPLAKPPESQEWVKAR